MTLAFFGYKLSATAAIFILTLLSTYVSLVIKSRVKESIRIMSFCNCFAGGIVFGALLMHVLPTLFEPIYINHNNETLKYPIGALFAGLSFLILFAIDRLFLSGANHSLSLEDGPESLDEYRGHHQKVAVSNVDAKHMDNLFVTRVPLKNNTEKNTKMHAVIFIVALSFHSFFEGLGIGGITNEKELFSFFIGLFSHKGLEGFAFGTTLYSAKFGSLVTFGLNLFYSLLTPVGIIIGMVASKGNPTLEKEIMLVVFKGLSVGSLLFVCCVEMIPPEFITIDRSSKYKFLVCTFGFVLMGAMALLDD